MDTKKTHYRVDERDAMFTSEETRKTFQKLKALEKKMKMREREALKPELPQYPLELIYAAELDLFLVPNNE